MRQMNDKLKFTLKAWPMIAAATIGLCFLTQGVAKLFGIDLPDQEQMTTVRNYLLHTFDSMQHFKVTVSLLLQVLLMAPMLEEALFRQLGWRLPVKFLARGKSAAVWAFAVASSAVFSAAHYIDYIALVKSGGFQWLPLSNAFLALFFFGLAQCWIYRKTDRIWCPMLNHALFNLTNLVLLFVVPEGQEAASILTCGF